MFLHQKNLLAYGPIFGGHLNSKLRAPFERVFSQDNKRVRYVGIAKNQFAAFMNTICFNLKRMLVLLPQEKFAYKR